MSHGAIVFKLMNDARMHKIEFGSDIWREIYIQYFIANSSMWGSFRLTPIMAVWAAPLVCTTHSTEFPNAKFFKLA